MTTGAETSPAPVGLPCVEQARAHLMQALHVALCATADATGCSGPCLRATAAAEAWVVEHFAHAVAITDPNRYLNFRVVGPWGADSAIDEADARAQVAQARAEMPSRAHEVYWVATPAATWDDGSTWSGEDQPVHGTATRLSTDLGPCERCVEDGYDPPRPATHVRRGPEGPYAACASPWHMV